MPDLPSRSPQSLPARSSRRALDFASALATSLLVEDRIEEVRCCYGHEGWITAAAFLGGGRHALSSGSDGTLRLWDLESAVEVRRIGEVSGWVLGFAISPDNRLVASIGDDESVRLWDLDNAQAGWTASGGETRAVQFTRDGQYVITGHRAELRIWDLHGRLVGSRPLEGLPSWSAISSIAISQDGRRLLIGSDQSPHLLYFDLPSARLLRTLGDHDDFVQSVVFVPGDRYGFSASWDGTVRMWELETGSENQRLVHPVTHSYPRSGLVNDVVPLSNGESVLTMCDNVVRLWRLEPTHVTHEFRLPENHTALGGSISRGSRFLLLRADDGRLRVLALPICSDDAMNGLLTPVSTLPRELAVGERIVTLPDQTSVGDLAVADDVSILQNGVWDEIWQEYRDARGVVRVPPGKMLRLTLHANASSNPSFLDRLGPLDLAALDLSGVPGSALAFISHLSGLRAIVLPESTDDSGAESLSSLDLIEWLVCNGAPDLRGIGLRCVSSFSRLRHLDLAYCSALADDVFRYLEGNANLEFLRLEDTPVSGAYLASLHHASKLTCLSLSSTHITDKALLTLPPLPALSRLELWDTAVGDRVVEHLTHFPALVDLNMGGTDITDRGVALISRMGHLQSLVLCRTRITDRSVPALAKLTDLRWLSVEDTGLSVSGKHELRRRLHGTELHGV